RLDAANWPPTLADRWYAPSARASGRLLGRRLQRWHRDAKPAGRRSTPSTHAGAPAPRRRTRREHRRIGQEGPRHRTDLAPRLGPTAARDSTPPGARLSSWLYAPPPA